MDEHRREYLEERIADLDDQIKRLEKERENLVNEQEIGERTISLTGDRSPIEVLAPSDVGAFNFTVRGATELIPLSETIRLTEWLIKQLHRLSRGASSALNCGVMIGPELTADQAKEVDLVIFRYGEGRHIGRVRRKTDKQVWIGDNVMVDLDWCADIHEVVVK